MKVICPYCDQRAELVTGKEVYPDRPDLRRKKIYVCWDCDARVGCHEGTRKPLGRMANEELRHAKIRAHSAFDPIWQEGPLSRRGAYRWLAERLAIRFDDCHIGMFSLGTCHKVVSICEERMRKLRA